MPIHTEMYATNLLLFPNILKYFLLGSYLAKMICYDFVLKQSVRVPSVNKKVMTDLIAFDCNVFQMNQKIKPRRSRQDARPKREYLAKINFISVVFFVLGSPGTRSYQESMLFRNVASLCSSYGMIHT